MNWKGVFRRTEKRSKKYFIKKLFCDIVICKQTPYAS